ncbi:hypothetical protein [Planctomicrobium piriforme]|uniref:Uncharacterized protein n=1 Tax=Planctomicrobium piriforme TaxID=1576369 RepID=A0A1I3BLG0_9PLAN|nr:hypothetical protein [Planctomicrobium piriforme]SFH62769.1 hypothetical protein SAMN05421753_101504 [Planctomicrobium piriforme]
MPGRWSLLLLVLFAVILPSAGCGNGPKEAVGPPSPPPPPLTPEQLKGEKEMAKKAKPN